MSNEKENSTSVDVRREYEKFVDELLSEIKEEIYRIACERSKSAALTDDAVLHAANRVLLGGHCWGNGVLSVIDRCHQRLRCMTRKG